jgi:hypothetical protein
MHLSQSTPPPSVHSWHCFGTGKEVFKNKIEQD